MNPKLLDRITFKPDVSALLAALHVEAGSDDAAHVERLVAEATGIARPKALYGEATVDERGEDWVVIDGVKFSSRVLKVNLDGVHRVFPFVATCGMELEKWSRGIGDILVRYWADGIMLAALRQASAALEAAVDGEYHPGKMARMNPGSLADWPIKEQRPLFTLLREPERTAGVTLTESFLMVPAKSISGIIFPTEVTYENCQLCPRAVCSGRRAPYDEGLYMRKYGKPAK